MTARRIVASVATTDVDAVRAFHAEIFGLEVVMNRGWIVTLPWGEKGGGAGEGGSGTPVPAPILGVEPRD